MADIEIVAEQKRGEGLDVHLLVIPDEVEVYLLGDDDGALQKALAVQGANVARAAGKPEKGVDVAQAGNIKIGREMDRIICRVDVVLAWQFHELVARRWLRGRIRD